MKELKIHKAEILRDTDPIYPVTVIIDQDLPPRERTIEHIEETMNDDAEALAMALFYSLPQGTLDRLLIKLMKRKVSAYRGLTKS